MLVPIALLQREHTGTGGHQQLAITGLVDLAAGLAAGTPCLPAAERSLDAKGMINHYEII